MDPSSELFTVVYEREESLFSSGCLPVHDDDGGDKDGRSKSVFQHYNSAVLALTPLVTWQSGFMSH